MGSAFATLEAESGLISVSLALRNTSSSAIPITQRLKPEFISPTLQIMSIKGAVFVLLLTQRLSDSLPGMAQHYALS